MDREKLKLYMIVFVMGITTTVMNFTNSILASFVGLLLSSIIVHAIGLIPSTIFFLTYERDGLKGWKSIFKSRTQEGQASDFAITNKKVS